MQSTKSQLFFDKKAKAIQWRKDILFNNDFLEQLGIHTPNSEARFSPYTCYKVNSKWILDLNVKYKTIEPLEANIRANLSDFGFGNEFLNLTLRTQSIEEKK